MWTVSGKFSLNNCNISKILQNKTFCLDGTSNAKKRVAVQMPEDGLDSMMLVRADHTAGQTDSSEANLHERRQKGAVFGRLPGMNWRGIQPVKIGFFRSPG